MDFIWRAGDPWRPLGDKLREAGTATVVTTHGTTYLADYTEARYKRLPLEGGIVLAADGEWLPLVDMVASACSVVVIGELTWCVSMPVRLAVAGLHPDWPTTLGAEGRKVLTASVRKRPVPVAPGHPAYVCPVASCLAVVAN